MKELLDYIELEMSKGYSGEQVRAKLLKNGYSLKSIDKALQEHDNRQNIDFDINNMPEFKKPELKGLSEVSTQVKENINTTKDILTAQPDSNIFRKETPKEKSSKILHIVKDQIKQTFNKEPKLKLPREARPNKKVLEYIEKEHKKGFELSLIQRKLIDSGYDKEKACECIEQYRSTHEKHLVKFIKRQRSKSIPLPDIKNKLESAGYSNEAIRNSMDLYKEELASLIPKQSQNVAVIIAVSLILLFGGLVYVQQLFDPPLPTQSIIVENPNPSAMSNEDVSTIVDDFKNRAQDESPTDIDVGKKLEEIGQKAKEDPAKQPTTAERLKQEEKMQELINAELGNEPCELAANKNEKDQCFLRLAQKNINETYCHKINQEEIKRSCINTINKVKVFMK
jgi:hypothetical protein